MATTIATPKAVSENAEGERLLDDEADDRAIRRTDQFQGGDGAQLIHRQRVDDERDDDRRDDDQDRHEHAKLTLHFRDDEDRQVIFLLLLADGGQVFPAVDLPCDSGFIDARIKADQHGIDVGGDERAAARCRFASLQRRRDGKLDRPGHRAA